MQAATNMMNAAGGGGPVGATPGAINQFAARMTGEQENPQLQLNTYIYEYLLKIKKFDVARAFCQNCSVKTKDDKGSPARREVNGVDTMDADSKDGLKRPDDLPEPVVPPGEFETGFLMEWWCVFWDIFNARRKGTQSVASDYLQYQHSQQRMRQQSQAVMINRVDPSFVRLGGMMNLQAANGMNMMKQAVANNRNANPHMTQKMMHGQIQRDPSNAEMGGPRPQTPGGTADNAPSPSKRPRLDGAGGFDGQVMGPGRSQPMQGQPMGVMAGPGANGGQLMMQNGMNPNDLAQQQINFPGAGPDHQKLQFGGLNGMAQGGPMGQQPNMENFPLGPNGAGGEGKASGGRHALQDYQMQLMMLEQQNKRRLLQAREQGPIAPPGSAPPNQLNFPSGAPSMSPSGSRSGPSPNPNDQLKRVSGTPKMAQTGLPGSPMTTDMQNRGSPAPNFDPASGQMQQGMNPQFYNSQMPGGVMARPPSSHPQFSLNMGAIPQAQMDQIRMANGGRMPNGGPWPQQGAPQPMMQQQNAAQQPPQMGTPQQRPGNMPPPPAPVQEQQQQRTQPSSPAQPPAAPPTPSQQPKSAPKKKETAKKKNPAKKASQAAATPAPDTNEQPPTPTPATPMTPMHANSFNKPQANGTLGQQAAAVVAANAAQAQPQTQPGGQPPQTNAAPAPPPMEANQPAQAFAGIGAGIGDEPGFNLDFAGLDSENVLDSFDFDSFLQNTDDNNAFGSQFDLAGFSTDGVKGE